MRRLIKAERQYGHTTELGNSICLKDDEHTQTFAVTTVDIRAFIVLCTIKNCKY